MENITKKWRFVSNNNAGETGINDAGIETFSKDFTNSLVRESIQNSLDARLDKSKPVTVEFSLFDTDVTRIPDCNGLLEAVEKCLISNKNDTVAQEYFKRGKELLSGKKIPILRISDYNTIGLLGSETPEKRDTNWYGLVKKEGSSNNKGGTSGGSFGIGKNAYFGISDLRTVFFTSFNKKNHKSNIGIAKLISFEDTSPDDNKYWTTGKGYYSEDNKFTAIEEILPLEDNYNRYEYGTDIYVVGVTKQLNNSKFKESIIKYVLINFFVSILTDQLKVKIQGETIEKSNMELYISQLNDLHDSDLKDLKEYYYLLTGQKQIDNMKVVLDKKEFGEKYGFEDGECVLYIKKGNDQKLNRKILMTRKTGMRLFEQNRINGHIQFTGVMRIIGDNMNRVFREMELPSHDAWEPGRCRDKANEYNQIKKDFLTYLKDKVNELISEPVGKEIEAFHVDEFIKNITENKKEKKYTHCDLSSKIVKTDVKEVNPKQIKKEMSIKDVSTIDDIPGKKSDKKKSNPKPDKDLPPKPHKDEEKKSYKEVEVANQMLLGLDVSKGKFSYRYQMPKKAKNWMIEFSILGEQRKENLDINSATIETNNSKAQITSIDGNKIYVSNLNKNNMVTIDFNINFKFNCSLEVKHYEGK